MKIDLSEMEEKEFAESKKHNYIQSAIIGYWRMGASWIEIGLLAGITPESAEKIVQEYLKKKGT